MKTILVHILLRNQHFFFASGTAMSSTVLDTVFTLDPFRFPVSQNVTFGKYDPFDKRTM